MTHRVFVDANVLASRTLRDWLFLISQRSAMFQLHSSVDAIYEAGRAVRRKHPTADGSLIPRLEEKLRENLDEVLTEFPGDVPFTGTDVNDQHVHAAALHSGAHILLTDNATHDFGDPDTLPYDIYTADEFLCLADDGSHHVVLDVTSFQNHYWQRRRAEGSATKSLAAALEDAGCPEFARRIEAQLRFLSGHK